MDTETNETELAARLRSAIEPVPALEDRELRNVFTARLREVAARPDVVPIEFDGRQIEVRRGGTILGAAMKNGVRLMHVCGARTLCGTCRVVVESGEDNLTPMRANRKILAPLASIGESADATGMPGARERAGRGRIGISAVRRVAERIGDRDVVAN